MLLQNSSNSIKTTKTTDYYKIEIRLIFSTYITDVLISIWLPISRLLLVPSNNKPTTLTGILNRYGLSHAVKAENVMVLTLVCYTINLFTYHISNTKCFIINDNLNTFLSMVKHYKCCKYVNERTLSGSWMGRTDHPHTAWHLHHWTMLYPRRQNCNIYPLYFTYIGIFGKCNCRLCGFWSWIVYNNWI